MKNVRVIVTVVICVCLCVGYFFYLSNKDNDKERELTEVEQIISMELDRAYPRTPKEVMKLYTKIEKVIYDEKYTDEQYKQLVNQMRVLFDDEYAGNTPEDVHLLTLNTEIEKFSSENKKIVRTSISSGNEIDYQKVQGDECAFVGVDYFLKGKKGTERVSQTFLLRKSDNRWKVLGIKQVLY